MRSSRSTWTRGRRARRKSLQTLNEDQGMSTKRIVDLIEENPELKALKEKLAAERGDKPPPQFDEETLRTPPKGFRFVDRKFDGDKWSATTTITPDWSRLSGWLAALRLIHVTAVRPRWYRLLHFLKIR